MIECETGWEHALGDISLEIELWKSGRKFGGLSRIFEFINKQILK